MAFRNPLRTLPFNAITGQVTTAQIADGAVGGTKLSADAIDGKTITGALIRTAGSGRRWELTGTPTSTFYAFTGAAGETAPGGLVVGDGTTASRDITLQTSTYSFGGDPASLTLSAGTSGRGGVSSADLTASDIALGLGSAAPLDRVHLVGAWDVPGAVDGDLLVTRKGKRSRIEWAAFAGTTDASGLLVVTHGLPFTPTAVFPVLINPLAVFAAVWGVDTITSTTFRVRFQSTNANTAATGVNVSINALMIE